MGNGLSVTVTGEIWGALLCFMAYLVMVLYRKKTKRDVCVRQMLLACLLLLVSDAGTWAYDGEAGGGVRVLLYLCNYLVYLCSYLLIAMFIWYMWQMAAREDEHAPLLFRVLWAGVGLSVLVHTVGIFFNLYFYIDAANVYHRTPAYPLSQLITVLAVLTLTWGTLHYRGRLSRFEIIAASSYFLLPTLGTLFQMFHYGVAFQQFGFAAATLITFFVREADIREELQATTERERESQCALQEAKDAAEERSRELDEQLAIVGSMAATYESIYYIDMKQLTFTELGRSGEYVENIIGSEGDASPAMNLMCRLIVAEADADAMREFTDFRTLDARLKDRLWIGRQFQAGSGRWNEGIFIAAKRNEDGSCRNVIWAVRNIHEIKLRELAYQKELEEARDQANAANAAKTAFLFNMSHDIRTPMNAITGYTSLIEKYLDDREKCRDYLGKIQDSSAFLLSLINNILELARIESGNEKLDEVICDTNCVQDAIVSIFSEQMEEKQLHFICRKELHTPYVWGDKVKLNQIFLNLVSNAYKYTPAGGTVEMTLRELPGDQPGWIQMQTILRDTGIGMSKEFLPTLFDAFSRERNSTESRVQGTGLGMPIVKKLVELMGGTITVESEPGKGTTFVVTIPNRIAEEAAPAPADEAPAEIDAAVFEGKRILMAEDNDLNAEIAEELLTDVGFTVERAADGILCVDLLEKAAPGYYDLILMDIQMPNMDGYKATRTIRALEDPGRSRIPIIAMTANAFESDRQDALRAGMNGHIAKPIEMQKLLATLVQFLQ